ncbi:MAG: hypothetical protein HOI20_26330 [Gemmatimonadetes bacterium]|jgi:hypothetical protein|nr:hypothetical protein [Gemmatimonadota bacterium]MBT5805122.1 hypothetical protein [Gemmatimonadota bacterium]MBT6907790.1 hypothetical protein [Gemmatimonadota bacterium]
MCSSRAMTYLILLFFIILPQATTAQVSHWQLGGNGLAWSENDTTRLFVDFESTPGAIQPTYFTPEETVFSQIDNWAFWRDPSDRVFDYLDGETPRMWKWNHGIPDPSENGSWLIDADPATYNPPKASDVEKETFTMDVAVPVPAVAFGFIPPIEGFRSDGTPLKTDFIPAFQVTAATVSEPPVIEGNVNPLSTVLADVDNNFTPEVRVDFERQYLRFVRYRRQISLLDEEREVNTIDNLSSVALLGTISEFQLFAEGVPQRSIYKTKITDIGESVNFGRLFWKGTAFRMVDGVPVKTPDAQAVLKIEMRTGRDESPAVFHEYMDTGLERVVSRDYFENNLRTRFLRVHAEADLTERQPKPGIRASISYDADNWTFWSAPFVESGQPISLNSGSYLQLRITMESASFDDWVRLDSLWIETAPLLAGDVQGELARLDDPQPARGFTEVSLGEMTDFVYDLKADFETVDAPGFDLLRIRTGNRTQFKSLQLGEGLLDTAPTEVTEEADGLLIRLPERITRANNPPLRVVFGTEVFEFATNFHSEVLDTEREVLPQPVVGADVSEALSTNSLRVLGISGESPNFVQDLNISAPVFTPNGDGINDELNISYALYRLPSAVPVVLDVYRLDGRRVAQVEIGQQDSGPQTLRWDGRDANGALLPPGIYLTTISLLSDFSVAPQFRTVGIAY